MSSSEKQRKDDTNQEPSQQWDAILPNVPVESRDLFNDIDDYQKKIQLEWETSKAAYQEKIDHLMKEFLHEKLDKISQGDPVKEPAKKPEAADKTSLVGANDLADMEEAETRLEHLLERVQRTIEAGKPRKTSRTFVDSRRSTVIHVRGYAIWRILKWGVLAAGVFLILGIGAYGLLQTRIIDPETALPYSHTTSLVFWDGKIHIADWFRKGLYVHEMKKGLPILSIDNIQNNFITGLAFSDKALWTSDGFQKKILQHTLTPEHQVMQSAPSPGKSPVGLYWDGFNLWSGDSELKTLYRHQKNDLEDILDEYSIPDAFLTSFQIKNNRVWLLDGRSRQVIVYRLQKPLKHLASFDLDPFLKGSNPTSISVEEKKIWILTENPPLLIQVSRRRLEKAKEEEF